ncbi:hypothetical protein ACFL3T_03480 [Patescibacteria group bacterium]
MVNESIQPTPERIQKLSDALKDLSVEELRALCNHNLTEMRQNEEDSF